MYFKLIKEKVWAPLSSLNPPLFIWAHAPGRKGKRSGICVLGVSILQFLYLIWNCFDSLVFSDFHFIKHVFNLSNVTLFLCFRGRSHKTCLAVLF